MPMYLNNKIDEMEAVLIYSDLTNTDPLNITIPLY